MKIELTALDKILAAYRNNERDFVTYQELTALLNSAAVKVSTNPAENEQLARDAQAIVAADVAALGQIRRAKKVGGSYQAEGTIVSTFATLSGETRHVFEFDQPAGMLHIFGPGQVEIAASAAPVDCSGTPASCPDNEGCGCACSPADAPQVVADERALSLLSGISRTIISLRDGWGDKNDADEAIANIAEVKSALAAAPVQAQEPVAYVWSVNGMVKTGGDSVFDGHEKFYRAPAQPLSRPAELRELQEKVSRYEVQMLRMAGCAGEFAKAACEVHTLIVTDDDIKEKLKGLKRYFVSESVDDIYEHSEGDLCKFKDIKVMIGTLGRPAAQGDAKDAERYRYLCSGHGLCDKIENKHLADAAIDLQIAAAIAAKAAS